MVVKFFDQRQNAKRCRRLGLSELPEDVLGNIAYIILKNPIYYLYIVVISIQYTTYTNKCIHTYKPSRVNSLN